MADDRWSKDEQDRPLYGHETKDSEDARRAREDIGSLGNEPEGAVEAEDDDDDEKEEEEDVSGIAE